MLVMFVTPLCELAKEQKPQKSSYVHNYPYSTVCTYICIDVLIDSVHWPLHAHLDIQYSTFKPETGGIEWKKHEELGRFQFQCIAIWVAFHFSYSKYVLSCINVQCVPRKRVISFCFSPPIDISGIFSTRNTVSISCTSRALTSDHFLLLISAISFVLVDAL